ncbi:MAG: DUF3137 domain-containing protein [Alphaproteobacteria bacterium]|nr:DUF3137 domain-containing protein [Alphaproteobacteria bacterium]
MTNLTHTSEYIELKHRFDLYYAEKLSPILEQNDKVRKRYLLSFILLFCMSVLFYPYLLYQLYLGVVPKEYIGLILCASAAVVMLTCGPVYVYKKKVKPQIMPDFANFFGTFSYIFEGKIDDAVLQTSDLFAKYDRSLGDDYFTGVYDGVGISIGEEKLLTVRYDSQNKEFTRKVFGGICILFEMNKNFKGRTVVLKDKGTIGNAFTKIQGLQTVRLEDSLFEKYFEVYSDDQIEARYLLTTAFMERMLKLRDLYDGNSIQFCFYRNKLLLAIPTRQDMFEANSFFRSNLNKKRIDLVFEQFFTVFSIVKLLKLNQHIGM